MALTNKTCFESETFHERRRNFGKYEVYFLKIIRSSCLGAENGR